MGSWREAGHDGGAHVFRIVFMVGQQARLDAMTFEETARMARVLAGDSVHRGKKIKRAQRDIVHISDRRGHDIEPRARFRCRFTSHGRLN